MSQIFSKFIPAWGQSLADSLSSTSGQVASTTQEDRTVTQGDDEQAFGLKPLIPGEGPLVE